MISKKIIFRKKAWGVLLILGSLLFSGMFWGVNQRIPVVEEFVLLQHWLSEKHFYLINHWKTKGSQLEVYHFANYDCDGDLFLIRGLGEGVVRSREWSRIIGPTVRKGECYGHFCRGGGGLWLYQLEDWLQKRFRAKVRPPSFLAFEKGRCHIIH